MSRLRFLFVLLLIIDLLALAVIRGWLGAPDGARGEPERLTNQLHPELIRLRRPSTAGTPPATSSPPPAVAEPAPAPAAPAAPEPLAPETAATSPRACLALSGLTATQADSLSSAIASPELTIDRTTSSAPNAWWVRIPPAATRAAAERKMDELRATGVTDLYLVQDRGPSQYAISLGLFKGEAAARQHLAELRAKGVRGAELATRNGTVHRLEIRGPENVLAPVASEVAATLPAAQRSECQP